MWSFWAYLRTLVMSMLVRHGAFAGLSILMILMMCACATHEASYPEGNTCDLTTSESGHPACLPPPGFFCEDPPADWDLKTSLGHNVRYLGQILPSEAWYGGRLPICPPNATRLVQDQDWKDAREGAKAIGHTIGRVLTVCETITEKMSKQPDNILAGWNDIQPETLEAVFMKCTSELDSLPAIPAYDDPWLAGAAARGFEDGYGEGVDEVYWRLLQIEAAIALVEVAVMPGIELIEIAVTRGIRASLAVVRRMPIFIPGAVGSAGAFLKSAPRVAEVVALGSSRILGRNMKMAGWLRLPGEFAHHIVAFGDKRAREALGILRKFKIDVDDALNGVYLPGYKTSPNPRGKIVHGNLHTDAYYNAVNKALRDATTRAEALRELRLIAFKLEHGIMP